MMMALLVLFEFRCWWKSWQQPIAALPNPSYIARAAKEEQPPQRPHWPGVWTQWRMLTRKFLTSRCPCWQQAAPGLCHWRPTATVGQGKDLVSRWNLQVGETTIHTALLSKCIRAVWCAHEAGASCICPDVWQEKERLQEGRKNSYWQIYL